MASCSESNEVLDAINEVFDEFEKNLADSSSSSDCSDESDCDFYDSDPDVMRQMRGELDSDESDDSDDYDSDNDQVVIEAMNLPTQEHRRIYDVVAAVDNELPPAIRTQVTKLLYPVLVPLLGIKIMRALTLLDEMLTPDLTQIFDTMKDSDLIVSLIKTLFIYAKNHSPDFLEGLNFTLEQLNPITH